MMARTRLKGQDDRDYRDTRVGHAVMYRYVILVHFICTE
jgi:hypothetical protein